MPTEPRTPAWVQEQRHEFKMTQEEFAIALGVDRGTVSKYERGANRPMWGLLELAILALHAGICREEVKS